MPPKLLFADERAEYPHDSAGHPATNGFQVTVAARLAEALALITAEV